MIKKLLVYTRELVPILIASLACSLGGFLFETFGVFLLLKSLFTLSLSQQNFLLLVLIGLVVGLSRYFEQYLGHFVAFKLLSNLRISVYHKMRFLAPARLDTKDKGKLLNLIHSDIERIEVFFAHTIVPVTTAVTYSFAMCYVFGKQFSILSVYLLFGYLIMGLFLPLLKRQSLTEHTNELSIEKNEIQNYLLETIIGKEDLKQLRAIPQRLNQLNQLFNQEFKTTIKIYQLTKTKEFFMSYSLLGLWIGFILLVKRSVGEFTSENMTYILLYPFTFGPVLALGNLSVSLSKALKAAKNVFGFLDEKSEIPDGQTKLSQVMPIEAKQLTFAYSDENPVIENVSLSINHEKIAGIVGKSGSGKSTFVKLVMRWYQNQLGELLLNTVESKKTSIDSVRSNINYVPQKAVLFSGTLRDNLTLRREGISDKQLLSMLNRMDLSKKISELPACLDTKIDANEPPFSSGELQRLELARALIVLPELLILDEPTSNLDTYNEQLFLKILKEQKQKALMITHRKQPLKICDVVYQAKDKKIERLK